MSRILSQAKFALHLIRLHPKILIVCTYEYLPLATLFKRIMGYKLVYDVQENYVKNLELNPTLGSTTKKKVGQIISIAERLAKVDLYLLAEKCYVHEMPKKTPYLILENKFEGETTATPPFRIPPKNGYSFIISGTLTPAFGTLEAILWFKEILKEYPSSELQIIGHCPLADFHLSLKKAVKNTPQIQLKSSALPVPHEEIIEAYQTADFAILAYRNKDSIRDKTPTKLFESAALGLPILISRNPNWEEFLTQFSGGVSIDFFDLASAVQNFNAALDQEFFSKSPDESFLWKSQHEEFIRAITSL